MKSAVSLALILLSTSVFATELTLEQALEQAKAKNSSILEKTLESENEQLDLEKAKILKLPTFDWSSSMSKDEDNDSYSHKIKMTQSLYQGNAIVNGIKKSEYEKEQSDLNLLNTVNDVNLEIIAYYIEALKYQNQLETYKQSLSELKVQYKNQKLLYDNKLLSKSDILELESEMLETETKMIEYENNYKIQIAKLQNAISYKGNDVITLKSPDVKIQKIDFKNDLNRSLENNTDLKISELTQLIDEKNIQIQKADYMPKIDFSFSYGSSDPELAESLGDWQWEAGISFTYELFDWQETKKSVKQKENTYEIQKISQNELLNEIELNLKTKYYELEKYEKQIEAQKKLLEAREETYKINKIKFQEKYIGITDYLESESNLTTAKLELINFETEYYLAYHEYLNIIK